MSPYRISHSSFDGGCVVIRRLSKYFSDIILCYFVKRVPPLEERGIKSEFDIDQLDFLPIQFIPFLIENGKVADFPLHKRVSSRKTTEGGMTLETLDFLPCATVRTDY